MSRNIGVPGGRFLRLREQRIELAITSRRLIDRVVTPRTKRVTMVMLAMPSDEMVTACLKSGVAPAGENGLPPCPCSASPDGCAHQHGAGFFLPAEVPLALSKRK